MLFSVFAFLSGWFLSRSSAPDQNCSEAVPPQDTPQKESGHGKTDSSIVAQIPPTPCQHNHSDRRKDDTPAWEKAAIISVAIGTIGLLAVNIFQMQATQDAAIAAARAADIAKDALHISQRAYVSDGAPSINFPTKSITVPLINGGHMPSGEVEVVIHEATINTPTPTTVTNLRNANEKHWGRYNFKSIPASGYPIAIAIPVPLMSEVALNSGLQLVVVAGSITYTDGFPDTSQQKWEFCERTRYQITMKRMLIGPCDPGENLLRQLEAIDGFPNNPEPYN
jgi:hypothetical protein